MNPEIGTMSVRSIFKDADEENLENTDNKNHASRNCRIQVCVIYIGGYKIRKSFRVIKVEFFLKKYSIMNHKKRLVLTLGGSELV